MPIWSRATSIASARPPMWMYSPGSSTGWRVEPGPSSPNSGCGSRAGALAPARGRVALADRIGGALASASREAGSPGAWMRWWGPRAPGRSRAVDRGRIGVADARDRSSGAAGCARAVGACVGLGAAAIVSAIAHAWQTRDRNSAEPASRPLRYPRRCLGWSSSGAAPFSNPALRRSLSPQPVSRCAPGRPAGRAARRPIVLLDLPRRIAQPGRRVAVNRRARARLAG
jgi:hypothetical protein